MCETTAEVRSFCGLNSSRMVEYYLTRGVTPSATEAVPSFYVFIYIFISLLIYLYWSLLCLTSGVCEHIWEAAMKEQCAHTKDIFIFCVTYHAHFWQKMFLLL